MKPKYSFPCSKSLEELKTLRIEFCKKLIDLLAKKKPVCYFDCTSTHLWERRVKCWTSPKEPLSVMLPKKRGKGITIYGGIGKGLFKRNQKMVYSLAKSTNKRDFG